MKSKTEKSIMWTIVITILAFPLLYLCVFNLTGIISEKIFNLLKLGSLDSYLILDSIITFFIICIFFSLLSLFNQFYSHAVIVICAFSMFIFWGVESNFFTNGLNPMYPAWYEVNMAFNDIAAAILILFIKKKTKDINSIAV